MEYWSSSHFINGDSSINFTYPFHNVDNYSMLETQQEAMLHGHHHVPPTMMDIASYGEASNNIINGHEMNKNKNKKKMTSEQVKLLETSFQEDAKLDPERKMKLSKELGLKPRKIAVWFQNKKARWKNKQLVHLYESLRQEFDVVSREKLLLQEELMQLKSMIRENGSSKKIQTWEEICREAISGQYQIN
ncbi:unnamed protein product [Cochlearia groenlandica]